MLHNLDCSPPFKSKTLDIIQIPKLSGRINKKLITTSRLSLGKLSVNNKTTKQQTVLGAMSLM
jgi:hypothetical protein